MNKVLLLIFCCLSLSMFGQKVDKTTFDSIVKTIDFSDLWCSDSVYAGDYNKIIRRQEPFGYIGDNFQRLRIHFISVIKKIETPNIYFVYGKTKVKGNICTFQGELRIDSLIKTSDKYDPDCSPATFYGTYLLYEDSDQKGSGILSGQFQTNICIDKQNNMIYDWIALGAGGYRNNQFEGIWTSYSSGNSKVCNWGDYRIPNSKEFDMGAAELSPHPKYYSFGWDFYKALYTEMDKIEKDKIISKEFSKWWK
ncbi:MAG: hypothetical protein H6600_04425 [Flavobacteriales bacterium]|nr:hypothetical protein [Flavobacteriales bacterium]